ncbi:acyloxyacyl hydrolase [Geomonas sp. Red32]|uniref:acyloxyacyl hydrolase n=1 Tax=Geomonas sp. Red32 TaxID=2912856 RepID=UPI00202CF6FB|nr:acyloxyacyl hydrolase [Geomonas sp. Red32]MCM0084020.1 acyloxyacyl hydrolase [Geomonas sp. Red32]
MRAMLAFLILLAVMLVFPSAGFCQDPDQGLQSFGIRGGYMATQRNEYFHQYEAFVSFGLPWSVRADNGWGLEMSANAAAGGIHAAGQTGFIAAVGPGFIVDKAGGKGFAFVVGGDLNGLTQYRFGSVDLNGHVLFDGHAGVQYRFDNGLGVGYRFQHMSNGGLNGSRNTGVDFHMFEVSVNIRK